MLLSGNSLAQESRAPLPKPDFDLTREQKEAIVVCFQENQACHDSLAHAISPPTYRDEWTEFIGTFVLGLTGGMILANQLHH